MFIDHYEQCIGFPWQSFGSWGQGSGGGVGRRKAGGVVSVRRIQKLPHKGQFQPAPMGSAAGQSQDNKQCLYLCVRRFKKEKK